MSFDFLLHDVVGYADFEDDDGVPAIKQFRTLLTRRWGGSDGRNFVLWVMLNPSTATGVRNDPTLKAIIEMTHNMGYNALRVVNLVTYRTSIPSQLYAWLDKQKEPQGAYLDKCANLIWFQIQLASEVILAHGQHVLVKRREPWHRVLLRTQAQLVYKFTVDAGHVPLCVGVNRDGSPRHPLARGGHRVPRDVIPQPFTMR
jgi:hypothetical protein